MGKAIDSGVEKEINLDTAFGNLKKKIAGVIEDAASLEVATFTGDFSYKASELVEGSNNSKFDIANIASKLDMKANVDMQLVAYTKINIDSDTVNIVKNNLSAEDAELVALHKSMVDSAQKSRAAMIDMVKKLIKG